MKKLLTYAVVVATIAWSFGLGAVVPLASAAYTPVAGDLIKIASDSAVYYIDSNGKRNLTVNAGTFWTWYSGSWSSIKFGADTKTIKVISQADFDALPSSGKNVSVRPGTLLKIGKTITKIFAVSSELGADGKPVKYEMTDAVAKALFGNDYAGKVVTVTTSFENDYSTDAKSLTSSSKLPDGFLAKYTGTSDIYYLEGGKKRAVSGDAFTANKFKNSSVWSIPTSMTYDAGSSITGEEAALTNVARGTGGSVSSATGTVTVTLASDQPTAGLVFSNAQRVKFTKLNLTASSDSDAVIDSLVVKRVGVAADSDFNELILLDASNQVIGNAQTLNSAHQVTFTEDITVAKGTTKVIYLAANMATVGGGNAPALSLEAVTPKSGSKVSASLPLVGTTQTENANITIGSVTVSSSGAAYNPSAATKQVGTENYIMASLKATANSTEDIQIESIRWYQASTTADSDLANMELLIDGGTVIATGSLVDKAVVFNFATPYQINKGEAKEFSLRGDIVNGSGRIASFGPNKKTDWVIKGKTNGAYLLPVYNTNGGATSNTEPYLIPGSLLTIDKGSLTFSKATLASTNVAPAGAGQELSAFYAQVIGEPVIITRISVDVATSSARITNVRIVDPQGNTVVSPVDPTADTGVVTTGGRFATSTDTWTIPVGTSKYTIKGDLVSSSHWQSNASLAIRLNAAAVTAKGQTTNLTITASPSSNLSLDTLTVKTASLTVKNSSSPAAQSVVKGTVGHTFANFTFDTSGAGEDIKINQLSIKHTTTAPGNLGDIQNITLYDGTTALNVPVQGSSETADSTQASTATTTITLITPLVVPKNTVKTLALKGDISGSATTTASEGLTFGHKFGIVQAANVTALGATTGTSVTASVTASDGQLQTISGGGTLRYYAAGANPGNQILVGNTLGNTVAVVNMEALYENIEISSIGMTFNSAAGANLVSSVDVTDGTNTWNVPVSGQYATVSPSVGSLIIPMGGVKTLTVKANTALVGYGKPGAAGGSFTITFSNVVPKGKSSGLTANDGSSSQLTVTGNTTASNTSYAYASKPTVSGFTSSMGNGSDRTLFQFSMAADAKGDVGFYKVTFDITTSAGNASAGVTTTNLRFIESPGGSQTDLSYRETNYTFTDPDGRLETIISGDGGTYRYNILFNTAAYTASPNWEYRIIPAGQSKTYALIGNVQKSGTVNVSYSVALIGDNAAATIGDATTIDALANDSFIWSDLNYGNNTGTATATNEWTNGYLLFATSTQSASF